MQTKVKVVLDVLKGEKTRAEITAKYGIHATQINNWKKAVLEVIPEAFSTKRKQQDNDQQALVDDLYKQIGQLEVENDFLKKIYDSSTCDSKNVDRARSFRVKYQKAVLLVEHQQVKFILPTRWHR
ncbi:transposase, IS3 family [Bathymodiolus japonicus methanotrophic gill symbiont]|uniref:hypothetical protein n=1 Tax=Bathymodiolus japonicus methanotrophic gill symbiont TaxID=113269 RepID=UPI001B6EDD88|nr:hypothetical protein [Bathymodiolus japonicus methanotrophic gill symbiont]GFO71592.1 transposase, IS3 family [Bathymodiolus japonicus methanotrophic gill symbiont]